MSSNPNGDPQSVAIEQRERFGLSAYAARIFVALASLGTGTARDVSQVSEVPRTRVYDAIDELHDRGLVDILQSSPKRFWAISAETASRPFEHKLEHRTEIPRTALSELEPIERRAEQRGVWTVDGQTAVTERVLEFFASAEEETVAIATNREPTALEPLHNTVDPDALEALPVGFIRLTESLPFRSCSLAMM